MRLFGGERIAAVMQRLKVPEGEPIESGLVTKSVGNAQKKVESNNFGVRKRLLEYDNVMNQQREVIYDRRRHALLGERLRSEILEYVRELSEDWYDEHHSTGDVEALKNDVRVTMLCDVVMTANEFSSAKREDVVQRIVDAAEEYYDRKESMLGSDFMGALERVAALRAIDDEWRDHLRSMDDLKEGIYLRAYGQKDPILEYKQEAYKVFLELISQINKATVAFAFKYYPQIAEQQRQQPVQQPVQRQSTPQREASSTATTSLPPLRSSVSTSRPLQFSHPSASTTLGADPNAAAVGEHGQSHTIHKAGPKVGRNEPCPCGSGKKFKSCHGLNGATTYSG
jgi:preprotein translocase subunit SecA